MAEIIDAFDFESAPKFNPEKACSRCGVVKSLNEYHKDKRKSDGVVSECKSCVSKRASKNAYEWKLGRKYNLTLDQYNEMAMLQCGSCCVCGDIPCEAPEAAQGKQRSRLVVDHNHTTNEVRGLICSGCNLSLGRMKDNSSVIRRLASYVEGTL